MKNSQLLADVDGREAADALIGTVQRRNKVLLVVVGDVELKAQTEAIGFHGALPHALHAGDGIARLFCSGPSGLTMKRKRKPNVALRPGAFNAGVVRREFPLELSANGGNTEPNIGIVLRERSDFNSVNALIEAVDRGFEGTLWGFGNMQHEMQNCVSRL